MKCIIFWRDKVILRLKLIKILIAKLLVKYFKIWLWFWIFCVHELFVQIFDQIKMLI